MEKFEPRKLPTVLNAEELIDKAFKRASRVTGRDRKKKTVDKLATVSNVITDYLNKVTSAHPSYENLPEFYRELVDITVGIRKIKKSLAAMNWASETTRKIVNKNIGNLKRGKDPDIILKSTYGRISSIIKQIDSELRFLNKAKNLMRRIPSLDDLPTVVVAGYPNVGKSSFVASISTVKPEIATYPFTTREIYVGFRKMNGDRIQIIDTPGLLDRPIHKRNQIEMRAILCLRYLADIIVFIIDPTETCGYTLKDQLSLLEEIKRSFDAKILPVYSKSDLHRMKDLIPFSNVTGEGIKELIDIITEEIKASGKE
ncbi:MAG TPA: GTP-binding protein [Archaeoglobaceae archaeon]|nr:GTP-binding protein [Archaeoglobaceae archaeon]